jgi:hypothetical protein
MQVQCDRSGKILSSVREGARVCFLNIFRVMLASAIRSSSPPISNRGARSGLDQLILIALMTPFQ